MKKINLAKALKLKNNLIKDLNEIRDNIIAYNAFRTDLNDHKDYVVEELLKEEKSSLQALIELKTAIKKASSGIVDKLTLLEEYKSRVTFLKSIPSRKTKEPIHYSSETIVEKDVQVTKKEIDGMIKSIETDIIKIQDEIDNYNIDTLIEL